MKESLKRLDDALAGFYGHSIFKRYFVGNAQRIFPIRTGRLFADSWTAKALYGFIAMLFLRVLNPIFGLLSNCYRGSAFLNMIGLAAENHRWLR